MTAAQKKSKKTPTKNSEIQANANPTDSSSDNILQLRYQELKFKAANIAAQFSTHKAAVDEAVKSLRFQGYKNQAALYEFMLLALTNAGNYQKLLSERKIPFDNRGVMHDPILPTLKCVFGQQKTYAEKGNVWEYERSALAYAPVQWVLWQMQVKPADAAEYIRDFVYPLGAEGDAISKRGITAMQEYYRVQNGILDKRKKEETEASELVAEHLVATGSVIELEPSVAKGLGADNPMFGDFTLILARKNADGSVSLHSEPNLKEATVRALVLKRKKAAEDWKNSQQNKEAEARIGFNRETVMQLLEIKL